MWDRPKGYQFSRSELYALVWAEPVRTVAKRLGVSDVGLAKACRYADIPLPGKGYWAKKEAGKPIRAVALPQRGIGKSDEIVIGGGRYHEPPRESDEELLAATLPPPPTFAESYDEVAQRVRALLAKVPIPMSLKRTHREIASLLEADEVRRVKFLEHGYSWEKPLFDTPLARRKLRILNGLTTALARVGFATSIRGGGPIELNTRVGDYGISWQLEADAARPHKKATAKSGLRLSISLPTGAPAQLAASWSDLPERDLESVARTILETIIIAGEYRYRSHVLSMYEWRIERRQRLVAERERLLIEAERRRVEALERARKQEEDALIDQARRWRQATDVRAYVAARVAVQGTPDEVMNNWVRWAMEVADRMDPLCAPLRNTEAKA